jgi:tetratricopeptide (TPR) repeat protein
MYTRLGDQRQAGEQARRALDAAARAGDTAAAGKAHGVLALSGHWSGTAADGVRHGEQAVCMLSAHPDQQWWLGMAHIYIAMNHVLTGNFEAGLTAARRADEVAHKIGDPRLRNYAGWASGWLELSRGHVDEAIAASRASLEHAPDRVSRAYALVILSFALLEKGKQREALEYLQPTQLEFAAFPFPQWEALASVLLGEALRLDGSLEQAERAVQHGIEVATHVGYGYAAALGERVRSRIQSG